MRISKIEKNALAFEFSAVTDAVYFQDPVKPLADTDKHIGNQTAGQPFLQKGDYPKKRGQCQCQGLHPRQNAVRGLAHPKHPPAPENHLQSNGEHPEIPAGLF